MVGLGKIEQKELILTISNIVARENYLTLSELICNTRRREIVVSRQIAHKLCYDLIENVTLELVGEIIGKRNHTTVLHSIRTVNNLNETDRIYRLRYERLFNKLSIMFKKKTQKQIIVKSRLNYSRNLIRMRSAAIRHKMPYILTNNL